MSLLPTPPTPAQEKPELFVSYAGSNNRYRKNRKGGWVDKFVEEVELQLEDQLGYPGFSIFYDPDIDKRSRIDEVLKQKLKEAKAFLAVYSNGYVSSLWCPVEEKIFLDHKEPSAFFVIEYQFMNGKRPERIGAVTGYGFWFTYNGDYLTYGTEAAKVIGEKKSEAEFAYRCRVLASDLARHLSPRINIPQMRKAAMSPTMVQSLERFKEITRADLMKFVYILKNAVLERAKAPDQPPDSASAPEGEARSEEWVFAQEKDPFARLSSALEGYDLFERDALFDALINLV